MSLLAVAAVLFLQLGGPTHAQITDLPAITQWFGPSVPVDTDWTKITTEYVFISEDNLDQFRPLSDWSLQIKTSDETRDASLVDFDRGDFGNSDAYKFKKKDDMSISYIHEGAPILNVFWNRKGLTETSDDVTSLFCAYDYADYRSGSGVCDNREEQIWSFDLVQGEDGTKIGLSCHDTLEYERYQPYSRCPFAGAKVEQIHLRYLKNYLVRMTPKESLPTTLPTEPAIVEPPITCDCWTAECSYCEDPACRVSYDVSGNNSEGISIRSKIAYKFINTVHLFGSNGALLGSVHVSKRAVMLSGCIRCRPKRFPKSEEGGQIYDWHLSFKDSTLIVTVNGRVIFRQELIGECAEHYADIKEFAFGDIGCEGQFVVKRDMVPGSHYTDTHTCGRECTELE